MVRDWIARCVCVLCTVLMCSASASATDAVPGWFWYNDPIVLEPEQPEPQTVEDGDPARMPMVDTQAPSYSTAWIRENLPKLRDAAVDTPTPENVRAYLYVQRLAMDRAGEFQAAVSVVTASDPYLDQVSRFPTSAKGVAVGEQMAERGKEDVLFGLSRNAGLWFFYRSDCRYCHAMVGILLMLERKYSFKIIPISLDGLPLDTRLPDFAVDRGQAAQLGVETTPSMFLVRPPDMKNVVPLAQGFVALGELEDRIVRMAYYRGWISKKQYDTTRIATPMRLNPSNAVEQSMDPREIVEQLRPTHTAQAELPQE